MRIPNFTCLRIALVIFVAGMFTPDRAPALEVIFETSAQNLVYELLGENIEVSNFKLQGSGVSTGVFYDGLDAVGFDSGIILSSGSAANVVGPNKSDSITKVNYQVGDSDLNSLIPGYTRTTRRFWSSISSLRPMSSRSIRVQLG